MEAMPPNDSPKSLIDVQRIVDDIQQRALQARTARGAVGPGGVDRRELQPGRVVLRPEVAYSSKPVVGPVITAAKRLVIRLNWHFLHDMTDQINAALEGQRTTASDNARLREDLKSRLDALSKRLDELEAAQPGGSTDGISQPDKALNGQGAEALPG